MCASLCSLLFPFSPLCSPPAVLQACRGSVTPSRVEMQRCPCLLSHANPKHSSLSLISIVSLQKLVSRIRIVKTVAINLLTSTDPS
ncbi:hypothetical protein E2C01_024177 [Portunus trituberculatus]|uniref:Secreted protein n=1 Tax=Portunus trituberculatus TaxID=210409 RepID=A0A5B7EDP4_PORTR|nr:hypothetical protein [Portunus trituberculatus]